MLLKIGVSDENDVTSQSSQLGNYLGTSNVTTEQTPQSSQLGNLLGTSNVTTERTSSSVIPPPIRTVAISSSSLPTVVVTSPKQSTSSNRFSNPKKDLIKYLERKSEVIILNH